MQRSSLVALAVCSLSFGCAPSNPGLTIDGVLAASDSCTFDVSSAFIVEAVLDTNQDVPTTIRPGGVRYLAVVRVANHLINTGNRIYPLMADPNGVTLEAAEVEILGSDGAIFPFDGLPNPFRVTAIGTIPSSNSNDPQVGTSVVEVLPEQYGIALAGAASGQLIFSIRMIGVTAGGATLVSGRSLLPVRLCNGCLFRCGVDDMGMPVDAPSCSPGQDSVTLAAALCP